MLTTISLAGNILLPHLNRRMGSPLGEGLRTILRIDDGNGRDVDYVLDLCAALQQVYRLRHARQDGPQRFCSGQLRQYPGCDVAGLQVGEDQDIGSPLQSRKWEDLLQLFGVDSQVRLHFSVDDQRRIGESNQFDRATHFVA